MKVVIRLLFFFLFSFSAFAAKECRLNNQTVVLSGPYLMLFEQMGILNPERNIKAISNLYKLKEDYKGKMLSGGIFLSQREIAPYKNDLIIFDKSRELSRTFKKFGLNKTIEVNSRDQDPFSFTRSQLVLLKSLTQNCESEILAIDKKLREVEALMKKREKNLKAIFFLGKIRTRKALPNLVISNDGFVLELKKYSYFSTYESKLSYASWSQKELKKYRKEYLFLGLNDLESDEFRIKKVAPQFYNLFFRGALVPGIRQVLFLDKLMRSSFSF